MYLLTVTVKDGCGKELPRHWKYVKANVYTTLTKEGMYWFTNLPRYDFVLEVVLHNLATGKISVYSSTHAERNVPRNPT